MPPPVLDFSCAIAHGPQQLVLVDRQAAYAHAGGTVRAVTQGCIDILGPMGISREHLLEKWMRDCRITDIYEGTGEIQRLIIARGLLDYTREHGATLLTVTHDSELLNRFDRVVDFKDLNRWRP